jgi:hypothetical protein
MSGDQFCVFRCGGPCLQHGRQYSRHRGGADWRLRALRFVVSCLRILRV